MSNNDFQPSESFRIGIILAISGGFWDTYTYLLRGNVFANAETGNIVLFGISLAKGDFYGAFNFFVPIAAFALGVITTELIRKKFKYISLFHWRNIIITIEILLIFMVGFIPEEINQPANIIVSFVCAMQVATFKRVWNCPCATTMCTGNLRSGTENLFKYIDTKDKEFLVKSCIYFSVIMFFIVGAAIGAVASILLGIKSIWITCIFLGTTYIVMRKYKKIN
ncbi:MAG: YoaK family protein [Lachnospirales bacterium]